MDVSIPDSGSALVKIRELAINDPFYTIRRYYIDKYFLEATHVLTEGMKILDVGGKRHGKRGEFNIEKMNLDVQYVNIDPSTSPDYECDASSIPVNKETFDAVVCGETLEHIPNPIDVLKEINRLLKPGGRVIITVPFMYHIHADPEDYGRYTPTYWRVAAGQAGFSGISIQPQGGLYVVAASLFKTWWQEWKSRKFSDKIIHKLIKPTVPFILRALLRRDVSGENKIFDSHTLGFGITLTK